MGRHKDLRKFPASVVRGGGGGEAMGRLSPAGRRGPARRASTGGHDDPAGRRSRPRPLRPLRVLRPRTRPPPPSPRPLSRKALEPHPNHHPHSIRLPPQHRQSPKNPHPRTSRANPKDRRDRENPGGGVGDAGGRVELGRKLSPGSISTQPPTNSQLSLLKDSFPAKPNPPSLLRPQVADPQAFFVWRGS